MLSKMLEVFFLGQLLAEHAAKEAMERCKTLGDRLNKEFSHPEQKDHWNSIDSAARAVKEDCRQVVEAIQGLWHNTGELFCACTKSGLPMLTWKCGDSMKQSMQRKLDQVKVAAKH